MKSLENSSLQFQGKPHLGEGIFRLSYKDQYGVVRDKDKSYLVARLSPTLTPTLQVAKSKFNLHRGSQTIFYFLDGRLIENDLLDVQTYPENSLTITFNTGKNSIPPFLLETSNARLCSSTFLKNVDSQSDLIRKTSAVLYKEPQHYSSHYYSSEKLKKSSSENTSPVAPLFYKTDENNNVIIDTIEENSMAEQVYLNLRNLALDKKYNSRIDSSTIIIPLPFMADDSILSLLYLESLIKKTRKNPDLALQQFIGDVDQYLSILPVAEEFTFPQQLTSAQSSLQYFETSSKELEQEIIADYAVDIAEHLSESGTAQESVETKDDIPQIEESLKVLTLKRAEEKALEKETKRQLFKQRQYWKNLADRKVQPTNEENKILKQANEQLKHKKTLFKYTTQESINREAKRSNATIEFNSAPHGYVTLKYKDGSRADKKILLSNHTDKSMASVSKMGAHALGHKFRNLVKTQRQTINQ